MTRHHKSIFLALAGFTLLAGTGNVHAGARLDDLQRCLQDFDGIEWKLPYTPPIRIRSCATPTINYDAGDNAPAGTRKLELIGELTLGKEADSVPWDERYAALQMAMYTHFNALFKQRGYRLVNTEQGNAREEHSRYTQCMLRRGSHCTEDAPEAPPPPIPYVSVARYAKESGARTITLTYKTAAKNTWTITFEGLSDEPEGKQ